MIINENRMRKFSKGWVTTFRIVIRERQQLQNIHVDRVIFIKFLWQKSKTSLKFNSMYVKTNIFHIFINRWVTFFGGCLKKHKIKTKELNIFKVNQII